MPPYRTITSNEEPLRLSLKQHIIDGERLGLEEALNPIFR